MSKLYVPCSSNRCIAQEHCAWCIGQQQQQLCKGVDITQMIGLGFTLPFSSVLVRRTLDYFPYLTFSARGVCVCAFELNWILPFLFIFSLDSSSAPDVYRALFSSLSIRSIHVQLYVHIHTFLSISYCDAGSRSSRGTFQRARERPRRYYQRETRLD
jgi:hypothetical protein